MTKRVVVAVTGASGVVYSIRLVEVLRAAGCDVHLSISANAVPVLQRELGLSVDVDRFRLEMLDLDRRPSDPRVDRLRGAAGRPELPDPPDVGTRAQPGVVRYHHYADFMAPIASGSFLTDGMVICPCSSSTLSAIVHGSGTNLIHRAAEVHLKERRKLILVPRETPLSLVQLDNLRRAAEAGAVILPAMPGFYHGAGTIGDLIDFVVARVCDQLAVPNELIRRWGT